ncbi:MAG: 3-hydroxyacyl-CoA dehydrogenase NAD-binding domain-containing protein [Vulcanimicrobiaceae bacterium]
MADTLTAETVRAQSRGEVRVLTLDNPPINAFSARQSAALLTAIDAAENDATIRAVVIAGANGNFSGGADINEFRKPPPPDAKNIRDVNAAIERARKTYIAAIDGNALGGGCELALTCDYRVATARSKIGLPEIKLGLLPGAGGTQRLTRLIGPQAALEFMLKGDAHSADRANKLGILDEIVDDDVVAAASAYAGKPRRRVSALTATAYPFMVAFAHKMVPPEERGGLAAHTLIDAVEAATQLTFPNGLAREARLFDELVRSAPAQALIHVFFAERELRKIPNLPPAEAREIKTAGVIGAGTMGTGIAITFANASIPVTVIESQPDQVERSKQLIFQNYAGQVLKGRMTEDEARRRGGLVSYGTDHAAIAGVDLIVEAVFEDMAVKQQVFAALDKAVKSDAILATNTSTLDVDAIAAATNRPAQVIGTHFFSPANVMKLLEVVRGDKSSPATIATAMKLAKTLRKTGVLAGNAFGFIGNYMLEDYGREAAYLLEDGALPHDVDRAMEAFGFAMGPFRVFDLAGIDVSWRIHQAHPPSAGRLSNIEARLVEAGRHGQKTSKGFYRYEAGQRAALPDPEVEALIRDESSQLGIVRRSVSSDEIVERCVYALINAGARLLADGIALRPGDIDIVWIFGYGFPPHRGGPMWYADEIGLDNIYARVREFEARFGATWTPAPLLAQLAESGGKFSDCRGPKSDA